MFFPCYIYQTKNIYKKNTILLRSYLTDEQRRHFRDCVKSTLSVWTFFSQHPREEEDKPYNCFPYHEREESNA